MPNNCQTSLQIMLLPIQIKGNTRKNFQNVRYLFAISRLSMNSLLYPSHGPLRSLTSHSCFALASMPNRHAKNEAPEEEAVLVLFTIVYRFKSCDYWDFEIFVSGFITT